MTNNGAAVTNSGATVLTPRTRTVLKRWAFWAIAGLVALGIGFGALATAGSVAAGGYLDPSNPAPAGARAVAEVLRQQGVDVVVTSSLEETRDAMTSPDTTTLLVHDLDQYLTAGPWGTVVGLAERVIVVDPGFAALRTIAPVLAQAGRVNGTLRSDCALPFVERAETVSGEGTGFRVIDDGDAEVTACLGSGDDVFSLVQVSRSSGTLTVLGATGALTNEFVVDHGNAAFALGLLGQTETLVWYQPSFADVPAGEPATLGDLSPDWVIPSLALLIVTTIAAAVWRGRRFGPLVVENLPVTVRASETMLGRARLYERSNSRLRALDALRIGSVQRLAAACGLPRLATVDEVVATVAATVGTQVADVRRLLIDDIPSSDRDLLALSDALLTLERDVTRASRP